MVTKMKNNKNLEEEKIEWKKLWEVTIWNKKFAGVEKHKQPKINSCHHYFSKDLKKLVSEKGEIKILTTNFSNVFADEEEVKTNISEGEIICIPGGGNPIVQYYNGKFITGDNKIATSYDKNKLNNKYLYYYLIHNIKLISEMYRGGTIKHPDMTKILEIQIPLPPLKKQEEIAAVLDKFTELTEELTEELTAREAQYNYYRDMLLSEDYLNKISKTNDSSNNNQIRFTTLGEVAQINRGASPRPISNFLTDDESGIAWIKIGDIEANSKYVTKTVQKITFEGAQKSRILKKGDFIISNSMSYGRPYILKIDGAIHDGWASISNFENHLDSDFLYHFLNSSMVKNYWKRKINGSLVSNLNSEIICSLPIIIVDKKLQKKIAQKLDKFQSLLSNTQGLLPKEIKLRQKQYEYYREKLLTF